MVVLVDGPFGEKFEVFLFVIAKGVVDLAERFGGDVAFPVGVFSSAFRVVNLGH